MSFESSSENGRTGMRVQVGGQCVQAAGPKCEKALKPNLVHSLGVTQFVVEADHRLERVELVDVACTLLVK